MSELTPDEVVRTIIESGNVTRIKQLFPNVIAPTNFAKAIGWNPSTFSERIEKAELFDMKAVRSVSGYLKGTPNEAFLLLYNQYLDILGEPVYKGDCEFDMRAVKKIQLLLKVSPMEALLILYNSYLKSIGEPPYKEEI